MSISITEKAAEKIKQGLQQEGLPRGGCSGLSYVMRFEKEKKNGDRVFEEYGVQVFVDMKSYLYLKGMGLDWQGSMMQQGFAFVNPNASRTCSCGQSFSV